MSGIKKCPSPSHFLSYGTIRFPIKQVPFLGSQDSGQLALPPADCLKEKKILRSMHQLE